MGAPGAAVNADLQKERQQATFNTLELTTLLCGGQDKYKRWKEIEAILFSYPEFRNVGYAHRDRQQHYEASLQKAIKLVVLKRKLNWSDEDLDMANALSRNETAFIMHKLMFIPTIKTLGTDDQKEAWLPRAEDYKIIGAYAQTELGHGTNLAFLETTATFDGLSDCFILHTPTKTATKWWPGGLARTSTHAMVIAQLIINGENQGLHAFLVQIRSLVDHAPLPGIHVGIMGPQLGFYHADNGFLILNNVKIPRSNMMMGIARVERDGEFTRTAPEKVLHGIMVGTRVEILRLSTYAMMMVTTMSIRYSAVRHQGRLQQQSQEIQILDYRTQQCKLFTALATTFAFHFTSLALEDQCQKSNVKVAQKDYSATIELHIQSSSLKAYFADIVIATTELCLRACGGNGYLLTSGAIFASLTSASPTVEGESTVLHLLTAKYLLKEGSKAMSAGIFPPNIEYLQHDDDYVSPIQTVADCGNLEYLVAVYKNMTKRCVMNVCDIVVKAVANGVEPHNAWNDNSVQLVQVAMMHSRLWTVLHFYGGLKSGMMSQDLRQVLTALFRLYAVNGILTCSGDFLQTGSLNTEQMDLMRVMQTQTLEEIRPNAVCLVDSFDINDYIMTSDIGSYDGNVYERLFNSAMRDPLNDGTSNEPYMDLLRSFFSGNEKSRL